jgi:3-hydroxybutyryl-CoA dehydrogenase
MMTIDNVTVLGTGVLGSQIAYQTAYSGFEVTAYDISDEILETARKRFAGLAARYEQEVAGASDGSARAALARIRYSSRLADAVRDAELVIESAPERLDIKRQLYTKLGPLAPEQTIFATNSSTLLPSDLADATGRPDRFLALHFANEIWSHNIAEIMGHPGTDPTVYDTVVDFARRIGMEPIQLHKEQPGYGVNSLLVPRSSKPPTASSSTASRTLRRSTRPGASPRAHRPARCSSWTSSGSPPPTTSRRPATRSPRPTPATSRSTTSTRASSAEPAAKASTSTTRRPRDRERARSTNEFLGFVRAKAPDPATG